MAKPQGRCELQADLPSGEWHCLAPELLDILKTKLEGSDDDVCITLQTMKSLRLVNRHWSLWATGATTMLRIAGRHVLFTEIAEALAKTFVNLNTLQLCRMNKIADDDLRTLLKLPSLTRLDFSGINCTIANSITDVSMEYLGRLTALRDLDLFISTRITDAGVKELTSLTSLTRLGLLHLPTVTVDSARWLGTLTGLRELTFMAAGIDDGIYYTKLTCLTRLCLLSVTGNITDHLRSLVNMRDLTLSCCHKIADLGLKHMTSFTTLRSLDLSECFGITNDGIRHLSALTSLVMLSLSYARITDDAMTHLVGLTGMKDLRLLCCDGITGVGVRELTSLTCLKVLSFGGCRYLTNEGVSYLGRLMALRDLDLSFCGRIGNDVNMMHLTLLTSLTRLHLNGCKGISDKGTMCLGSLTALRDLDLGYCNRITNIGLTHLASLTLLTRLVLDGLDKITDKGVECLGTLTGLKGLSLYKC